MKHFQDASSKAGVIDRLQQLATALCVAAAFFIPSSLRAAPDYFLSPTALAASPDGQRLYVACATPQEIKFLDLASQKVVHTVSLPAQPTGLALSADGRQLFVTCIGPASKVVRIEVAGGKVSGTFQAGHTAMAPVVTADGTGLFVCNRFDNDVSRIDLAAGKTLWRVPVKREPVAATMTSDGRFLLVANLLHDGAADADRVGAVVSVIDVTAGKIFRELRLPMGSGSLNDIRVSPDGRYAIVTHVLSRFHLPTTQLDRGWMNTNAKTIIDLAGMEVLNTVLLDSVDRGAANPWGIAWSADGKRVAVAISGTHELSVTDFPGLLAKLNALPAQLAPNAKFDYNAASRVRADVPNDLSFLADLRRRVPLPPNDRGPRAVTVIGSKAYVANYFSDTLSVVDLANEAAPVESIPLGPKRELTQVRQGELYFHDATICFQQWQSCASCHPGDARVDALNWDLLNDGIGNPKNTRSLLEAHRTPPAMSLGVRETAETAVRAGIQKILMSQQPESVAQALDVYLRQLRPVPSPKLVNGKLSASARRGKKLFEDARVGCASCHSGKLFTDLQTYDVGTRGRYDASADKFDTPSLIEAWRTAPYLHDGSAATIRELLTTKNLKDSHGQTSQLSPQEIADLAEYVLSL
jgi:DNA-binding beta-propeller fold protein YncE